MTDFGDSEPEDGWHPDDPPAILLENLVRRLVLLRASLGLIANDPERRRLRDLEDDLRFVIGKVRG